MSRQSLRQCGSQGHPGRERFLYELCVVRRQAVLGLQEGDRARLQVIFRQGFDLLDELRPDRGGLLDTKLFDVDATDIINRLIVRFGRDAVHTRLVAEAATFDWDRSAALVRKARADLIDLR